MEREDREENTNIDISEARVSLEFIKQKETEAFFLVDSFFFSFLSLSSGKLLVSLIQLSKCKECCRSFLRGRKNIINSRGGIRKTL